MIINNKIEKTLEGPTIFFGITFLIIGISMFFASMWVLGVAGILISLFLLFSYSGIVVDTERKAIKPYNCWFGIIKTGTWESMEKYIGLTLVPMNKVYSMYSRSNRRNESVERDYRIYLVNKSRKPSLALKRCKDKGKAQNSMDEFSIWLKLPVYTVKNLSV